MQEAFARMQRWAEGRLPALTRYRRGESLPILLHRRRIYIVPSAFGAGFAFLLMVMLVGALNYVNNAALLLTCLLGATSLSSMLVAFRALNGLRMESVQAGHAVAGEPIDVHLHFVSSGRPHQGIQIDMQGAQDAVALRPNENAQITLPLATLERGWQELPRIKVWTTWPFGLFRAWSWLYPQERVLVWPRPEIFGPPPNMPSDNEEIRQQWRRGDDLSALRDYRPGDPIRHIAWKVSARHHSLLVKEFEQPEGKQDWTLDWRTLEHLDNETRIARLARWLGEAETMGRHSSLWLPEEDIPAGRGRSHYERCMNALARLP
ncbi:DUF58 domain-containing protein [Dyella sp.]|uniref:DUF58 domain-containing protein n=1 Tax=Dyella sp. TaxID=1869338 RepID=UPI002ED41498